MAQTQQTRFRQYADTMEVLGFANPAAKPAQTGFEHKVLLNSEDVKI